MVLVELPSGVSYYAEKKLKHYLDKTVRPNLNTKDKDWVVIVDGYEGAGKSVFGMQMGACVDPTLCLERICMTSEEFKNAIINAKKGQCVIYDEAITGLSSADSIRKIGRILRSMMMQMRQKNLFVIIILPTIFELNKYAVLGRSRGFFHVYESKGKRGFFIGFNRRDTRNTYLLGKKTYTYRVRSRFNGKFFNKYVVDEAKYRKKKQDALFMVDDDELQTKEHKYKIQRDRILIGMRKKGKLTLDKMAKLMEEWKVSLGRDGIHQITHEHWDSKWQKEKEELKTPIISSEKPKKPPKNP